MSTPLSASALEKGFEKRSAADVRGWALLILTFQTLGEQTLRLPHCFN